jgi:hypothetical protein
MQLLREAEAQNRGRVAGEADTREPMPAESRGSD